jgi:uncharacterized protein YjhX (UPF0386 family)
LKKPQSGPILSVGARGGIIDHEDKRGEQELLEAIERHGEVTPAHVALETSLTVAEADRMLSELAQGGHLKVRVEEGKLLYGL